MTDRALHNQIAKLERRLKFLQSQYNYIGSCHAATLEYDGALKSMSKGRLRRLCAIGETMLENMTEGRAQDRLRNAIKARSDG